MSLLLVVRADADAEIGVGHVMRCLALAERWQSLVGGDVVFVGHIAKTTLAKKIAKHGFRLESMEPVLSARDDARLVRSLLNASTNSWLVVDGYGFGVDFFAELRGVQSAIMYIDDLGRDEICQNVDLVLNQNMGVDMSSYPCCNREKMLIGPGYTLLRREFVEVGSFVKDTVNPRRKIIVTMGGADPHNTTAQILQGLCEVQADIEVKVVVGPVNGHFESLVAMVPLLNYPCELLQGVDDMPAVMQWADLAVTAAGSTCWEFACLGVPMLVVVLADNQLVVAEGLVENGGAVNLGWYHELQSGVVASNISGLLKDHRRGEQLVANGKKLIDGLGAERVVRCMLTRHFSLRSVAWDDCDILFKWVNDPVTRENSLDSGAIPLKNHEQWLRLKMHEKDTRQYMGVASTNQPFGVVRFERDEGCFLLSVSIAPDFRGCGLCAPLLRMATEKFLLENRDSVLEAVIKKKNIVSQRAFEQAGFTSLVSAGGGDDSIMRYRYQGDGHGRSH